MSKDTPISFTAAMVVALISDRKTQTRRIGGDYAAGDVLRVRESYRIESRANARGQRWVLGTYLADGAAFHVALTEAEWAKFRRWKKPFAGKPPMYMFRSLSRIYLEVVSVRRDPLQDISAADAIAEGVHPTTWSSDDWAHPVFVNVEGNHSTPLSNFASLWDSINGSNTGRSWADNPEVKRVEFRRIERNHGMIEP